MSCILFLTFVTMLPALFSHDFSCFALLFSFFLILWRSPSYAQKEQRFYCLFDILQKVLNTEISKLYLFVLFSEDKKKKRGICMCTIKFLSFSLIFFPTIFLLINCDLLHTPQMNFFVKQSSAKLVLPEK